VKYQALPSPLPAFPQRLVNLACRPAFHFSNKASLIYRKLSFSNSAKRANIPVSNTIGAKVMQINKQTKKTGKARRRLNIPVLIRLPRLFPPFVTNRVNEVIPLVVVVEVYKLAARLSGSIGMEKEKAPNGGF
jgi:hypothetical protein